MNNSLTFVEWNSQSVMRAMHGLPCTRPYAGQVAPVTQQVLPAAAANRNPASTRGFTLRLSRSRPSVFMPAAAPRAGGSNAGAASNVPVGENVTASTSGAVAAPGAVGAPAAVRDDFAVDKRPIILFDGVCNLCNGGVNFMLDNDPNGVFRLAALQSQAGRRLLTRCGRSPNDISSIVLVEKDRHFVRSEAILRIGAALRVPLPLLAALGFPVPLLLRDTLYDAIANNRYSFFGRTDTCRLRDAGNFADRFLVD
ncbi:hypothetical protein VaNZ11_008374 [Volvox africanus]|uniref:Thiol-disulfide oxidoreductase DCC n=1 Tax=Volvox africanus TaxID=51714 RepID=A0ABQ5S4Y7_9CHLO|nr:hypothetical protein VaNZ11_008374 [Volvox africanus]